LTHDPDSEPAGRQVATLLTHDPDSEPAGRQVATLLTHDPDSEPICICSYSLMVFVKWRNNKFQFYSFYFLPDRARTHNLFTTLKGSLHHRYGLFMIRYQIFNQWDMVFLELFPDIFQVKKIKDRGYFRNGYMS
jgi:hypothetical protein